MGRNAAPWLQARTLNEYGDCVAQWLQLKLPHRPTAMYCDGVGAETTRLVPLLAALNRGGKFITECSQPGCTPLLRGYGGEQPYQRAAVMGFVPEHAIREVHARLGIPGLDLQISRPGSPSSVATQLSCKTIGGSEVRLFGAVLSRREIAEHFGRIPGWKDHPGLHSSVIAELRAAYQVSVVDTEWGRNTRLWQAVRKLT